MSTRAGVIGLGIMGGAFAKHLLAADVRTSGYDLLAANVEAFSAHGGHACKSSRALAAEADILITSLPHSAALDDALFGSDGVVAAGRTGLLVIETSTLSIEDKERARNRLAGAGIGMLDAPISGTGPQAQAKDITIFASGDRAEFERARILLSHFARSVQYVGPFGSGSKMKYIANLLVAIHIVGAAEAIVLGEKAGLDASTLVEVLSGSAATSRMLEVRGPSMATGAYATPMMKVDVFQKDLDIIANFAKQAQCPVPLFSASVPFYTAVAAQGMGLQDTAAVVSVLRSLAGMEEK
ncbi:MAG: NAD(P)-dependent oxidoreductase [Bryobacteraceae bacterium]|jgi:3-hydroxyisobutyrate dehydrogenase-like beta-hydroxyacid dehydrogenase